MSVRGLRWSVRAVCLLGVVSGVLLVWARTARAEESSEAVALDPLGMGLGLLGGLALFLYGIEKMTDGLKAAAGEQMKVILAKLTKNPISGALTGAFVTAIIQSSSVTTVLVVGFVSAGLMTLIQSVGVIFGANVGTTVTAQIVAFNTTALAMPLIAVGFAMNFASKKGRARHYGDMMMGLGLVFYGMAVMGEAMGPLRTHEGFQSLMQSMERPILGMLVGAVFTALIQSSSATISLAVVMATQGLITLPAGIALVFGAKIGTCATAMLASIGKPRDALRTATVHVLYNILGSLLWIAFIDQLAALAARVSPAAPELDGVERLAEEVPRQIANAATIWAVANMVIFLPFAGLFARIARKIVPDRPEVDTVLVRPRYLDETLIQVPSLALERVRLELSHMAELIEEMMAGVPEAFRARNSSALTTYHDKVSVLRDAILQSQRVGRQSLTDVESDEHSNLLYAANEIENISAAIATDLAPMCEAFRDADVAPSETTAALLVQLHEATTAATREGLRAIVKWDENAAREAMAHREEIWKRGEELLQRQADLLAEEDPKRLLKHRLQVDVLDKFRRIYGLAEQMAIAVLPRGALAGELARPS